MGDQAGAARAPPAETGDSVRALVNMIKKEEITVNVDLGVKIPVCCTPPLVLALGGVASLCCIGNELGEPPRHLLPFW